MPTTLATEAGVPITERLYELYRPRHYNLSLDVDPEKDEFSGRVAIDLELVRPAQRVVLHGADIAVTDARVNGEPLDPSRVEAKPNEQTLVLELGEELPAGPVYVEPAYRAPFGRQLHGLYIARARHNGKE